MLTATPRTPPAPGPQAPAGVRVSVRIRRRRSVAGLAGAFAVLAGVAAGTGSAAVWAAAAVIGLLGLVYVGLLVRLRRLAMEREMSVAFAHADTDWAGFEAELAAVRTSAASEDPVATVEVHRVGLARFLASYVLGWLLTPVVVVIRLAGGDLSDLERHRVIERLVRAQEVGRSQSLRLLAAGVVATAGVTAAGGVGIASASPAVASGLPTTTYTVQAGETLGSIAAAFGTTVPAIVAANHLGDPNLIFPGQELVIPGATGSGPSAATVAPTTSGGTYTVRSGDTLGSIAAQFGTTVANLAALNDLSDPNLIYVGQQLQVSGTAPAAAAAPASSPSAPSGAPGGTYTVEAGDTLASIASRFATTVANLAALNDLSDPNLIYVGEVLDVSGTATAAASAPASGTPAPDPNPAPAPAPSSGESASAAIAVKVALEQVGKPYVYGAAGPDSFDCSGLVMYAYAAAGVSLPHYTVTQYDDTTRITESQLLPGDLVFYDNYSGAQPGHVAMYIGNGDVVSANETGTNVQTQSISYDGTIIGFGRVG